jgi:hypothetical protein
MNMESKSSRILYLLLFYLGWVGILWTAYAFCVNVYNEITGISTEEPLFFILLFILLCVSLMSIATAFILEQTGRTKQ